MTRTPRLPPEFADLEPFSERWGGSTSNDRVRLRLESNCEDRERFYAAATPHLGRALEYLDQRLELTAADAYLFDLILTLAHVALAVEQQKEVEGRHAQAHAHFSFQRSARDLGGPTRPPSATS